MHVPSMQILMSVITLHFVSKCVLISLDHLNVVVGKDFNFKVTMLHVKVGTHRNGISKYHGYYEKLSRMPSGQTTLLAVPESVLEVSIFTDGGNTRNT